MRFIRQSIASARLYKYAYAYYAYAWPNDFGLSANAELLVVILHMQFHLICVQQSVSPGSSPSLAPKFTECRIRSSLRYSDNQPTDGTDNKTGFAVSYDPAPEKRDLYIQTSTRGGVSSDQQRAWLWSSGLGARKWFSPRKRERFYCSFITLIISNKWTNNFVNPEQNELLFSCCQASWKIICHILLILLPKGLSFVAKSIFSERGMKGSINKKNPTLIVWRLFGNICQILKVWGSSFEEDSYGNYKWTFA